MMRSPFAVPFICCCFFTTANAFKLKKARLKVGQSCGEAKDCISQHCVPMCDGGRGSSVCLEPEWVFKRHAIALPKCVDTTLMKKLKKYKSVATSHIGDTCHLESNCFSQNCKAECGSDLYKCIEPRAFYNRYNLKTPKCIEKDVSDAVSASNNAYSTKNIGEQCETSSDCVSDNCIDICEDHVSGMLCVENQKSFELNKILVPECIDMDSAKELYENFQNNNKKKLEEEEREDTEDKSMGGLLSGLMSSIFYSSQDKEDSRENKYVNVNDEVDHMWTLLKDEGKLGSDSDFEAEIKRFEEEELKGEFGDKYRAEEGDSSLMGSSSHMRMEKVRKQLRTMRKAEIERNDAARDDRRYYANRGVMAPDIELRRAKIRRRVDPLFKELGSCSLYQPPDDDERQEIVDFVQSVDFSHVDTYVTFFSVGNTGQSWIASIIDAAPNALVSHQFHALGKFKEEKLSRNELFMNIAYNSNVCGRYDRVQDYNYTIPGLWQGQVADRTPLKVIGDKAGGLTSLLLLEEGNRPWNEEGDAIAQRDLLVSFFEMLSIKNPKFIFVLRNPFNVIASLSLKEPHKPLDTFIFETLGQFRENLWARDHFGEKDQWLVFTMENFVSSTRKMVDKLCMFTDMLCPPEFISRVLKGTRHDLHDPWPKIKWERRQVEAINEFIVNHLAEFYVPLNLNEMHHADTLLD